jgi:hypothetical protein
VGWGWGRSDPGAEQILDPQVNIHSPRPQLLCQALQLLAMIALAPLRTNLLPPVNDSGSCCSREEQLQARGPDRCC